jgi:glycosyltransferase involved in cell wall biosynthesis
MGLRVGLVGPLPPPAGGMANQTAQLARLLIADGVEVEIIQTNAAYRPEWIAGVRGVRALFRLVPYLLRLWRAAGRCDLFHVMANSGWSWHLFAAPAIRIAHWRRRPVLVNYRGGEAEGFLRTSARSVASTLRHACILAVPSGFLRQVFATHGIEARILPNVVDLARFHPAGGEVAPGAAHVVVTRNLETIYGVDVALRAFAQVRARVPGARLSIAGTGPERAHLEQLCRQLGLADAVSFLGRIDPDGMATLLRGAQVALNASRVDNLPNALLEALASGVPVVSTDAGGIPWLLEDGRTGRLTPVDDVEALAAAVAAVLQDAALARTLSQNGLREARRYTWDEVRPVLMTAYRECLAGTAARVPVAEAGRG